MIKKIFIFHMGFMVLNILGIISVTFFMVWDIVNFPFYFKLGLSFLLGFILGLVLLLPMTGKYFDNGFLK